MFIKQIFIGTEKGMKKFVTTVFCFQIVSKSNYLELDKFVFECLDYILISLSYFIGFWSIFLQFLSPTVQFEQWLRKSKWESRHNRPLVFCYSGRISCWTVRNIILFVWHRAYICCSYERLCCIISISYL